MDEIQLVGGDLDNPPPYSFPILIAISLAQLQWGRLEQHLDMLLISVNKEDYTTEKFKPVPNSSFRIKCDLFERWFIRDPRFIEFRELATKLAVAFRTANEDRRVLIHSNLQHFNPGPPPSVLFKNILIEKENVKIGSAVWTENQIMNFASNVLGMNKALREISFMVLIPEFLNSLQKS